MKLARYIVVGVLQALLACGGIVFVEPFCHDASCAPGDASTDTDSEEASAFEPKPHPPDAFYPICPVRGGHCEWPGNAFIWCAGPSTFWLCESNVWFELECKAPGATNPLCDNGGNCVGSRCP